jgi:hypothetical protein
MVVLRERNQSGSVLNNAKVTVNGQMLSFNSSINEYKGNIGSLSQGQKVPVKIKTREGREISGHVQATYFVTISSPKPFTQFSIFMPIPIKWKFSNGNIYQIVFKILRGETQLFSTDVNGSSYTINPKAPRPNIPFIDFNRARVISPWTERYHFIGPFASGSKGQFFTSATVSIRFKK